MLLYSIQCTVHANVLLVCYSYCSVYGRAGICYYNPAPPFVSWVSLSHAMADGDPIRLHDSICVSFPLSFYHQVLWRFLFIDGDGTLKCEVVFLFVCCVLCCLFLFLPSVLPAYHHALTSRTPVGGAPLVFSWRWRVPWPWLLFWATMCWSEHENDNQPAQSLLTTFMEIKSDTFKLLFLFKRPMPRCECRFFNTVLCVSVGMLRVWCLTMPFTGLLLLCVV